METTQVFLCLFVIIGVVNLSVGSKEELHHGTPSHHGNQEHTLKDGQHNVHFDHEAILGSRKLEEEFDELPPEEAKRRLALLVKKMDKDADGFVSREELTDWILMSFRLLDKEDALDELEEKDENKDGQISWQEYQHSNYGYTDEEMRNLREDPKEDIKDFLIMVAEDEKKFEAADVNKDSLLDQEEYVAFVHPYNYEHMHHIELQRTMMDNDQNQDGYLSLDEFLGKGSHDREWQLVEEERFKEYDVDGDKKLSYDEMKPWVLSDNRQEAEDEAVHLMEIADLDGDGKLSEDEVVNSHQDFVGSQATDYGRHLHFIREEL